MALVTKATGLNLSPDMNSLQHAPYVVGTAGEALDAVAPCYIGSDGLVHMAISTTTVSGFPQYVGFTADDVVASGLPVTLFRVGARFHYASAMTPGGYLWIAATAGRLDTAQTGLDDEPVAVALSATDILVIE